MTVIDKHRLIEDSWELGCCEECRGNPKRVEMVREFLISGNPDSKSKSNRKYWVCPKCGYTKEL